MPSNESRKILIIAAEASSCLYAQRLLQHWKATGVNVEAFGVGNKAMADEGFQCLGWAEELAVMGFSEIIGHWPVIKKAFYDLLKAAEERKPQVVLLLDYPGFNLRFAKKMKAMGIPVVYYISPQIWAWRQGRVKIIQKLIDKMLVVFPFEKTFYKDHGVEVEFVGHPLLDELQPSHFDAGQRAIHRSKYGIMPDDLVLALMPGSRNAELRQHMDVQIQAARELQIQYPRLKVALFVAPNFTKDEVQARLNGLDFPLMLIKDEPFSMIDLADVVLCASGTATLMVGLLEKPMVIMYKMNPFSAAMAKIFVNKTKYFGLINLVLDRPAVTELFQEKADRDHLIENLKPLLSSRQARETMAKELASAKDRLGNKGATVRVAQALESYWSPRNA